MILCDVIQEREAQVDLKKRKQVIDKQIEEQWIELEKMKMQDYDAKVARKMEEELRKKRETAKVIKN
jgi:hypothetical protein